MTVCRASLDVRKTLEKPRVGFMPLQRENGRGEDLPVLMPLSPYADTQTLKAHNLNISHWRRMEEGHLPYDSARSELLEHKAEVKPLELSKVVHPETLGSSARQHSLQKIFPAC